jgi:hypothetical protein
MEPSFAVFWNAVLTIGVAIGVFFLNRVANTLDSLQKVDTALAKEISDLKTEYVPKAEYAKAYDKLEARLDAHSYQSAESNKLIHAKLDLITERLGNKMNRDECAKAGK